MSNATRGRGAAVGAAFAIGWQPFLRVIHLRRADHRQSTLYARVDEMVHR